MYRIAPIVEGEGDVEAVLNVLNRFLRNWHLDGYFCACKSMDTNGIGNILGFDHRIPERRHLAKFLAYARIEQMDGVMVIADADKACAAERARDIGQVAKELQLPFPVAVAVPRRCFETWLIASIDTIAGKTLSRNGDQREGIVVGAACPIDAESVRSPKGWLTRHMPPGRAYKESMDQLPMTQYMDEDRVRVRSRSFRHIESSLRVLVGLIEKGQRGIHPDPDYLTKFLKGDEII